MTEHLVAHYYKISSLDKLSTQTIQNFTVAAPNFDDAHSYRIEEIVMPVTWYPINSYNNTLVFNPNAGGNVTATITPGSYTSASFITELQTKMAAVSGGATYIATISSVTGKITITQNAGTYTIVRGSSTINYILGLSGTSTSVAALAFTSDNPVNLSGTNIVVVKSRELTKFNTKVITSVNGSQDDIICRIPVVVGWGATMVFKPHNKYLTYNGKRGTQIDLSLYDQWGNPLDMNGGDYFMSLKFHTGKLHNVELRHDIFTSGNKDLINDFTAMTFSNKN